MRLFIRKQNCLRAGTVAGYISDAQAQALDAEEEKSRQTGDTEERDAMIAELNVGMSACIEDCVSYDGSEKELLADFREESLMVCSDPNQAFRKRMADNVIEWLENYVAPKVEIVSHYQSATIYGNNLWHGVNDAAKAVSLEEIQRMGSFIDYILKNVTLKEQQWSDLRVIMKGKDETTHESSAESL
jgi:hypothetical protein